MHKLQFGLVDYMKENLAKIKPIKYTQTEYINHGFDQ